ncbi:cytidine deaminase [Anaerolentibacter hominis]|uniref:cytidine deaminase n=1 Tax=Anaerolentibacter hominis TaxID=3079009 RepID=UPI0031B7F7E8
MEEVNVKVLIAEAYEAVKKAYAPYSHFCVGAALQGSNGRIYHGCNIENASFGATNCAERTAIFKAVSVGVTDLKAIAIVGGPEEKINGSENPVLEYCAPCGICRQVMMEFCNPDTFQIILIKSPEEYRIFTLRDLLPEGFGPGNLKSE